MDMLDYYKRYYQDGGIYTMKEVAGPTSRVAQLLHWLKAHTKPGDRILDVGCGDGYLSTCLPDRDWQGIDVNVERAVCKAKVQDLMQAPWDLESGFSSIVCSEVAEHVWDLRILHQEAYRLLKPGGTYIVSTPNFNWIDNILGRWENIVYDPERPWTMEHIRHYTAMVHEKHLREAGFKIEDFTGLDAHYGEFFKEARAYLKFILTNVCRTPQYEDDSLVDCVIGRMFPNVSHTIAFLSRRPDGL